MAYKHTTITSGVAAVVKGIYDFHSAYHYGADYFDYQHAVALGLVDGMCVTMKGMRLYEKLMLDTLSGMHGDWIPHQREEFFLGEAI